MKFQSANTLFSLTLDSDTLYEHKAPYPEVLEREREREMGNDCH